MVAVTLHRRQVRRRETTGREAVVAGQEVVFVVAWKRITRLFAEEKVSEAALELAVK
jgi:hypothetical protein